MKATVVGANVPAKALRAACAKADVPAKDVRVVGPRAWVELPQDARDAVLSRLAEALATGLLVIDVDVPAGSRGEALTASRATYKGVEEDVTAEAKEIVQGWLAEGAGGGFDDDAAASDLAWALIGDSDSTTSPAEANAEELWATALLDKLIAAGSIELRGNQPPINRLAHVLESPGKDLGDRLLAELIDSTAVDEVFADADEIAKVARETKPRRQ